MGLLNALARSKRPKDTTVLEVYKSGTKRNNLQFRRDQQQIYYLERPDDNQRAWDYLLHRGSAQFHVHDGGPCFRIHRNQAEANIEFYKNPNDLVFTMEWRGKGDIGGLAAAPREHFFYYKGTQYEWSESGKLTGTDLVCKNLETKETVAYFRSVLTPADRAGKFELHLEVDEKFEEMLIATFIAYREWSIRRQMCLFGENWFNQSVTI